MQQFGRTQEHLSLPLTVLFRMSCFTLRLFPSYGFWRPGHNCVAICNVMDKIEYFGEIMFASKGVNVIEEAYLLVIQTRVT